MEAAAARLEVFGGILVGRLCAELDTNVPQIGPNVRLDELQQGDDATLRVTDAQAITRTNRTRSHDAVIRVYDAAGNVIETHEHKGDFKEP